MPSQQVFRVEVGRPMRAADGKFAAGPVSSLRQSRTSRTQRAKSKSRSGEDSKKG